MSVQRSQRTATTDIFRATDRRQPRQRRASARGYSKYSTTTGTLRFAQGDNVLGGGHSVKMHRTGCANLD